MGLIVLIILTIVFFFLINFVVGIFGFPTVVVALLAFLLAAMIVGY